MSDEYRLAPLAKPSQPERPPVIVSDAMPHGTPSDSRLPRFQLRGLLLFMGGFSLLCALTSATGISLTEALIGLGVVTFASLVTAAVVSVLYPSADERASQFD
jgi:hypothetical protein